MGGGVLSDFIMTLCGLGLVWSVGTVPGLESVQVSGGGVWQEAATPPSGQPAPSGGGQCCGQTGYK